MKKSLEKQILNAFSNAMLSKYSAYEFCINEYRDENICLICFNRAPKEQAQKMKNIFLENLTQKELLIS